MLPHYHFPLSNHCISIGESVPQMKEAVSYDSKSDASSSSNDIKLDMNGINRVNTLFSGCSFVTVSGKGDSSIKSTIPSPPDHGAIAYVLRTGFGSSQGKLLQMIEFSQQSVTGNAKETGLALLVLFIFALFASGYVLKVGLEKKEKTTHELLLKCVIIITSVVPRQFPMQVRCHYFMLYYVINFIYDSFCALLDGHGGKYGSNGAYKG